MSRIQKKYQKYGGDAQQTKATVAAEPMVLSSPAIIPPPEPSLSSTSTKKDTVQQVQFATNELIGEKLFNGSLLEAKDEHVESWSVLNFYKEKSVTESKVDVQIISDNEQLQEENKAEVLAAAAAPKKQSQPLQHKPKAAQKYSRKMNRFHKLSAMATSKNGDSAENVEDADEQQ